MIARTSGPAEGVSADAPQCTRAARCRSAREDRKPSLEISSDVLLQKVERRSNHRASISSCPRKVSGAGANHRVLQETGATQSRDAA